MVAVSSILPVAKQRGKRLLAPLIASFLSFLFVVIKPISQLGGEYAFLCYTSLLLFFFPGGTTGAQLEATFLGLLFAALGMAWCTVALAIAAKCSEIYGADSAQGRAVLGIGLFLMSFTCGWLRSYSPRLTIAARISLFFPIFHITSRADITEVNYRDFVDAFLVAAFAGAIALVSHLVFAFHGAGPECGRVICGTLEQMRQLLPLSVDLLTSESPAREVGQGHGHDLGLDLEPDLSSSGVSGRVKQSMLTKALRSSVASITPAYQAYQREIVRARSHPRDLQRIVQAIKHIARSPVFASTGHAPGERIRAALEKSIGISPETSRSRSRSRGRPRSGLPPWVRHQRGVSSSATSLAATSGLADSCQELTQSICAEWATAQRLLCEAYAWPVCEDEKRSETRLQSAIADLEDRLSGLLDAPLETRDAHVARDDFRLAFYMTSLLDLARDTAEMVRMAEALQVGSARLYISFPWSRSSPASKDESSATKQRESEEEGLEEDLRHLDFIHASLRRPRSHVETDHAGHAHSVWRRLWDHPQCLRARVLLSQLHHQTRHSRHVLFALKLSGGISLLALPAFMPPGTNARQWFEEWRFAWAVVSYMYVLEVHTGAILRVGFFRLLGTLTGAIAAFVGTKIAQSNPYGLVAVATVCSIPITYIILFTTFPGVGTVAGITLPPLLFIEYLDLAEGHSELHLAWTRFVDIAIGIIAAVLIGSLVWPDHARVRYFSVVSSLLDRLNAYYLSMSRDNLRASPIYANDPVSYAALESALRADIAHARTLVAVQRDEVSLLPRPVRLYAEVVDAAERMMETLQEVRMLRFSVPRQETVLDVLPIRQELVSAVLISLWAVAQAFRSRAPLPQFLPSAREPLGAVMDVIEEQGRGVRRRARAPGGRGTGVPLGVIVDADADVDATAEVGVDDRSRLSSPLQRQGRDELAFLYAMAENEAIGELCGVIDELVAAARTLFGTQTFLDTSVRQPRESVQVPRDAR